MNIPPNCLIKILSYVDPYNRTRFRAVSKSWCSLIDGRQWDPVANFIVAIETTGWNSTTPVVIQNVVDPENSLSRNKSHLRYQISPQMVPVNKIMEILQFTKPQHVELESNKIKLLKTLF